MFICQLEGGRSINKELRYTVICTVSEVVKREIGATQKGMVNSIILGSKYFLKVFVKEVIEVSLFFFFQPYLSIKILGGSPSLLLWHIFSYLIKYMEPVSILGTRLDTR